jgi:Phage tail tube protein
LIPIPYGSGLSAQIGLKTESTVGTEITVDRFYEFLSESITFQPTWLDSAGLKAGQAFKRVSRTVQSRFSAGGDWSLEHADKGGMGTIWKHALGSPITIPVQIGATTAWQQVHIPGMRTGLSHTIQVGRPQTDGTVRAFTYRGCKVTGFEFTCSDGEIAQLSLSVDGWQEATATALASASYTANMGVFTFADASTFTLGGTPTTGGSPSQISIAGGTAVTTVVRGITISGQWPLATERFGLGNAGVKREQIENGIPMITGTLEGEFTSRTEIYDLFKANTTTALQLDFTHGDAGSSNPYRLSFIMPAIKFKEAATNAAGPDILGQTIGFEAYDDGTNAPFQVRLVSTDTVL